MPCLSVQEQIAKAIENGTKVGDVNDAEDVKVAQESAQIFIHVLEGMDHYEDVYAVFGNLLNEMVLYEVDEVGEIIPNIIKELENVGEEQDVSAIYDMVVEDTVKIADKEAIMTLNEMAVLANAVLRIVLVKSNIIMHLA